MQGQLPPAKMPAPEVYPEITMTPPGQIGGSSVGGITAVPPIASVGDPSPPGAGEVGSGVPNPENYSEDFTTPGQPSDPPAKVNPGAV